MICVLGLVWDLGELDLICCLIKLSVILLIKSVRIKEMMDNLTGIDYFFFLSILWLSWKFRENWFCVELIIIKGISLGWISLNWRNVR